MIQRILSSLSKKSDTARAKASKSKPRRLRGESLERRELLTLTTLVTAPATTTPPGLIEVGAATGPYYSSNEATAPYVQAALTSAKVPTAPLTLSETTSAAAGQKTSAPYNPAIESWTASLVQSSPALQELFPPGFMSAVQQSASATSAEAAAPLLEAAKVTQSTAQLIKQVAPDESASNATPAHQESVAADYLLVALLGGFE